MSLIQQRQRILKRALKGHCPQCDGNTLFASRFRLNTACSACGLPLESEEGWSLGAVPLNYTFTCLFWVLPVGLLFAAGLLPLPLALIIGATGTVFIPIFTYRRTKALWVGVYYSVLPHECLPLPNPNTSHSPPANTPHDPQ